MPVQDRQQIQSLLDMMRRGADADARLAGTRRLFAQLNYEATRKLLPAQLPADAMKQLIGSPAVIATGGDDGSFLIIHVQLAAERLLRSAERAVVTALLKDYPYALFVFSNRDHSRWHLLNVKIARKEASDDNRDAKLRRLYRRISIAPEDRLRTATERVEKLDLPQSTRISSASRRWQSRKRTTTHSTLRPSPSSSSRSISALLIYAEDAITGVRGPESAGSSRSGCSTD